MPADESAAADETVARLSGMQRPKQPTGETTMTRVNTCKSTAIVAGRSVIVVPPDAKLGMFSAPVSPLFETLETAIASVGVPASDVVVRRSRGAIHDGWQVWGRRRSIGGKDRHQTGSGSRGRRVPVGPGRVFYQP